LAKGDNARLIISYLISISICFHKTCVHCCHCHPFLQYTADFTDPGARLSYEWAWPLNVDDDAIQSVW